MSVTSGEAASPTPRRTLAANRRWSKILREADNTKPQATAWAVISTPVVDRQTAIATPARMTSRAPPQRARISIEIASGAHANASMWM